MNKDNVANNDIPDMEDYGNTDGNWDKEEVVADQLPESDKDQNPNQTSEDWDKEDMVADRGDGSQNQRQDTPAWDREDMVADGLNEGQNQAQGSGQFGEFGTTGTGVDLTVEMDSDKADVRAGLVKGGQPGEDGLAGLGQYGGKAGGIPPQGNIDGNE